MLAVVLGFLSAAFPAVGTAGASTLPALLPTGDGSRDAVIKTQAGGTTGLFASIDEGIAATDNGTTYIRNDNKTSGSYLALLTDMPADLTGMSTLTIDIRARTTGVVDDSTTLFAQIVQADEVTPLSDEVAVAVNPGTSAWTTVSGVAFTGLVLTATKADWDGARLRLRWAHSPVGTADTTQLRLTAVELHGTYSSGPTPPSPPTCSNTTLTTTKDTAADTAPLCSDANGDPLIYGIVSQGALGTASAVAGKLYYVPKTGATGSDSFTYKANDGSADSNLATVTVTINASGDPVIAAAGDIACDPASTSFKGGLGTASACHQRYTSDLLVNAGLAAVLALGDTQYGCGGLSAFQQSYDPTWGRVKAITHPVTGNHEYQTSGGTGCSAGAAGYFGYFGGAAGDPSKGYYSFDVGSWHLIALNSSCSRVGGCGAGSAQEQWLRSDLAAHPAACTLAYWHHARFSSSSPASNAAYDAFWQDLYNAGADIVLVGHSHHYERFAPLNPAGNVDAQRGIREFVVGTGGEDHSGFNQVLPTSEVQHSDFGVLKLTLHPTGFDWQFVSEAGKTFTDSGSTSCH